MDHLAVFVANAAGLRRKGHVVMLDAMVLQMALSAFSTMFGSLGVFCTYLSFLQPSLGAQALVFLSTATAIVWSQPQK
jgi:hypothetical protein